ncbi:hypothetical protein MTR67_040645 [Solanum verrucosum]|uniref:RNase H type-1 domain-containing protein n=1 Tax=Solanum verrucosum TaxID=315347 RepID=A0AAF0UIX0_SOLVR|nr:hypothetical protein MTR67_040645 [Solanum verrucosum]
MLEVSSSKPLASESKGFAFWVELVAPGLPSAGYLSYVVCELLHRSGGFTLKPVTSCRRPKPLKAQKIPLYVKWNPPKQPCYMLKTVGMVCQLHNLSGIGGVFRNHEGTWILGFKGSIAHRDAFSTELYALFTGLALELEHNIRPLEINIDARRVYKEQNQIADGLANLATSGTVDTCLQVFWDTPHHPSEILCKD